MEAVGVANVAVGSVEVEAVLVGGSDGHCQSGGLRRDTNCSQCSC